MSFIMLEKGDLFGGHFFLIQSNSWLEEYESEARRKGATCVFLNSYFLHLVLSWNVGI